MLDPSQELLPDYKISPFRTEDITFNNNQPDDNYIEEYFDKRFSEKRYQYTFNGREAINSALSYYRLQKNDIVTILTTTGNFYISSCVTNEIEKFCKWSRQIESNTRSSWLTMNLVILMQNCISLKETGIPIIEDCAHSFFSKDMNNNIGNVGDFVIYSFPKIFPLQIGGLLVSNFTRRVEKRNQIDDVKLRYIKNVLSYYIKTEEEIIKKENLIISTLKTNLSHQV